MSESFNKLKAILEEKGALSQEDIETVTKEHGELPAQQMMELESLKIKLGKSGRKEVTMEEYLEATKKLDELEEGSEEYKAAEAIVEAFESGG